jgi:hypothetical protein
MSNIGITNKKCQCFSRIQQPIRLVWDATIQIKSDTQITAHAIFTHPLMKMLSHAIANFF